jgi:hypothetical protein
MRQLAAGRKPAAATDSQLVLALPQSPQEGPTPKKARKASSVASTAAAASPSSATQPTDKLDIQELLRGIGDKRTVNGALIDLDIHPAPPALGRHMRTLT